MGKYSVLILILKVLLLLVENDLVLSFNLSPVPNLVIREPSFRTSLPKYRKSYFGFSIVLKYKTILIGAPRAQSTLESQRKINETGAIYRCSIVDGNCEPFILDNQGNTIIENSEYSYDSEKKDYQWLGGSMDGGPNDKDKFVACAPRRIANLPGIEYLLHGVCYWTRDTSVARPIQVYKISPLRLKNKQLKEGRTARYYYHSFGEQGVSVHITENGEEIIIGAPGIHTWKGSVVRYRANNPNNGTGVSRRSNSNNSKRYKRQATDYISEIPDPDSWEQPNDSYFGYSVSSGYFSYVNETRLLYLATAPQAKKQTGEAYIFDIDRDYWGEYKINKYVTFTGSQFGEYFGYCGLLEDLNGDNLVDVIISAPLYAVELNYDKGAVYIFMNKGELEFEEPIKVIGKSDQPARFGTTVSKLGDINHDGFKDIAIGAPFEDDGVVYIYLGSEKGLRNIPSQIIKSPAISTVLGTSMSKTAALFGHGLSKGVDVDGNEYNDLAIGAPEMESVFLYRTYPVIKILAKIDSPSRSLTMNQTKFQIRACYSMETSSLKIRTQEVLFKIIADPHVKRVKLTSQSNEMQFTNAVSRSEICRLIYGDVKYSLKDIFKPIYLEMQYEVVNKVPNSTEFCENCVAVDPHDSVYATAKISFNTGCASDICVADLKLKSSGFPSVFIIGASKTFSIKYEIHNSGETAYLPQINITSSNGMPFAKVPSFCEEENSFLVCDLMGAQPLENGNKVTLEILFDSTNLEGNKFSIKAEVFSAGNELTSTDNILENFITLEEKSVIESIGKPLTPDLNLEGVLNTTTIINEFEIRNHGPSRISKMDVIISIPNTYLLPDSESRIPLIDFNNIIINATYRGHILPAELYQNNTFLIQNTQESSSSTTSTPFSSSVDYYQQNEDNRALINMPNFYEEGNLATDNLFERNKRNTPEETTTEEYSRVARKTEEFKDDYIGKLPINRTILFDCAHPDETLCIRAVLRVNNFQAGPESDSIRITVSYNIDLEEINKILVEPKEFFVIKNTLSISKIDNKEGESIVLKKTDPYNLISKHPIYKTPLWVYIISVLGGILLLALVTYILYKMGFFRREKKEELQKLYRASQRITPSEDE